MKKLSSKVLRILLCGILLLLGGCIIKRNNLLNADTKIQEEKTKTEFTKEEFLADYDMMWETLEENYYFFPILKDKGINIESLKNSTRQQLVDKTPDLKEFQSLLSAMFDKMERFAHLGIINQVTFRTYYSDPNRMEGGWKRAIQRPQTQRTYAFLEENETIRHNNLNIYAEIDATYDVKRKAVTFCFHTFDYSVRERDKNMISEYLESLGEAEIDHIIFDLQGNGGGDNGYWMDNIVAPFGGNYEWTDWQYVRDTELMREYFFNDEWNPQPIDRISGHKIPEFAEELKLTHYIEKNWKMLYDAVLPENILKAKRWVIINNGVYSVMDSFASFCKKTGWATVVGQPTLGDGNGTSPVMFSLPNTGFLIMFSGDAGETTGGTLNVLTGTKPDVFVKMRGQYNSYDVINQLIDEMDP